MKKQLLILALSLPAWLLAQQPATGKLKPTVVGGAQTPSPDIFTLDQIKPDSSIVKPKQTPTSSVKRSSRPYNFVKVGNTKYDLQTNASMGRRIVVLPDGTISLAWTTATDASSSFTDRGTGYNHFNGTSWLTVASPTPRLESTRIGWPSIGYNGNTEWVMGHSATDGGFVKSNNSAIGSTTWTSGSPILRQSLRRPIWGRIMNNGDTFHCISNYSDSGAVGEPRAPRINGVFAPWTYSRSTDGGNTWTTQHILLPGYDSSRYVSGGGDQYAIDVKGSTVAIVAGDLLEDVAVWKSTDNGTTFTKIICDTFKYAPYNDNKLILDTPYVCDGSMDVLIDEAGKVHAFWGVNRVLNLDSTDDSYSFFPGTAMIAAWSEATMQTQIIANSLTFDRNSDNAYNIERGTYSSLGAGQTIPSGLSSVARLGNTGLFHMPSAGIDANGNIYVSFSAPIEEDVDLNLVNYRDVIMVHSTDGGLTWSAPADLTRDIQREEEFACVARVVNNFVHVVFQSDEYPGTNLQSNSPNTGNHPVPDAGNDIFYIAVPVSKILDGSLGNDPVGVKTFDANKEVFIVSQNRPNPFSNSSEVIIWLADESNVTIEITNMAGQVVSVQNFNTLGSGNHSLTIDGENLASGMYFYTIKTQTNSATQKMMIQR
ncbi:MAG: T9SS type A sorting domain-containing protein [Bacteroidota bacterium]